MTRRRRVRPFTALASLPLLLALAGGCSAHHESNRDLDGLLAAYREKNQQLEERQQAYRTQGIRHLEVHPAGPGKPALVDLDVEGALLGVVLEKLVEGAGLGLVTGPYPLASRTTARLSGQPLTEVLDQLLAPAGLAAKVSDGVVTLAEGRGLGIGERARGEGDETVGGGGDGGDGGDRGAAVGGRVTVEHPLRHASTDSVAKILDSMYPVNEDSGQREVAFAVRPETNSIFLSGPPAEVANASRLLDRVDTDPGHVLLEALVVEFNVQSFLELGSRLADGSHGHLKNVFLDFANLSGETISFTRAAEAAGSTSFSAMLNLLIENEDARIISRPWLTTLSGSPAKLEIAEDRYVVTEIPGGLDVNLDKISSGVDLDITPTVTLDGMIRLKMAITESQFIPSLENVQQRRSRNSVSTVTQVGDGETVIIGGLMLRRRSRSKAGIPYLRDIFPLSWVFGHEDYSHTDSQVLIYVTPHLWEPGMSLPLQSPKDFELYPPSGNPVGDEAGARPDRAP
jgi:Bacterial type II and III secretion system protein/Bacterial type II/III secretion system short domain